MTKRARSTSKSKFVTHAEVMAGLTSVQKVTETITPHEEDGHLKHYTMYVVGDTGFYAIYEIMYSGLEKRLMPHEWPPGLLKKFHEF
jgi:hypothetical protein